MTKYAKIEDGVVSQVEVTATQIANRKDMGGYLPIKRVAKPQETIDFKAKPVYFHRDTHVLQDWEMVARPEPEKNRYVDKVKELQREVAKDVRDNALSSMSYELPDGKKIQTRPQDKMNIEEAINGGKDLPWVMEDNTVRITTVAELQMAYDYGVTTAKQIWYDYCAAIS